MIKEYKITIVLFLISVSLPLVVLNIKPPEFITPKEMELISFSEPKEMSIIKRQKLAEATLFDPFNLSQKIPKQEILETKKIPLVLPNISLIYEGKNRYVLIGDKILVEGESFEEYKITQILHDRVLIQNKKGEKTWLRMESY